MENLFGKPDITQAKRILAIQPHYDDNDIAAGGTLAALTRSGAELVYLTISDDLVGVVDQTLTSDEMTASLRRDQAEAGELIGVKEHYWLGYPDAGRYDYFDLRRDIIQHIRMVRPNFIFTCDPWTPYEAHRDHVQAGLAASEAAILYNLTRLETVPEVDNGFDPFELDGIVFYASAHPNMVFDISATHAIKHKALEAYRVQFSPEDLEKLKAYLAYKEQAYAENESFSHGEPLKVLRTMHLHVSPDTWLI